MVVRHMGATSKECKMPGGGPQGTNLGILPYLLNINSCGVSILNCVQNSTSQMTQGTRRPNQMEFKARPNIAGKCLDIF